MQTPPPSGLGTPGQYSNVPPMPQTLTPQYGPGMLCTMHSTLIESLEILYSIICCLYCTSISIIVVY